MIQQFSGVKYKISMIFIINSNIINTFHQIFGFEPNLIIVFDSNKTSVVISQLIRTLDRSGLPSLFSWSLVNGFPGAHPTASSHYPLHIGLELWPLYWRPVFGWTQVLSVYSNSSLNSITDLYLNFVYYFSKHMSLDLTSIMSAINEKFYLVLNKKNLFKIFLLKIVNWLNQFLIGYLACKIFPTILTLRKFFWILLMMKLKKIHSIN